MKNIAFIINPISGTINKRKLPKVIDKLIDHNQFITDVVFTEYKGHGTILARNYASLGFDAVVAVGGDGTVNEVASGLRDTQTALGIIPVGSGNGFARHLQIPLRVPRAIEMINHSEPISVDYGMINEQPFFCTCGSGFDAMISEQFAAAGKRGITTYLQKIIKDLFNYQPENYIIKSDGVNLETKAFLITFANANQWGNAAQIAPKASVQDGQMNIAVLSPFSLLLAPGLALSLFTKTIDHSLYMNTLHAKEITLVREKEGPFHYDGEPATMPAEVNIKIIPDGLRVLVEKRF